MYCILSTIIITSLISALLFSANMLRSGVTLWVYSVLCTLYDPKIISIGWTNPSLCVVPIYQNNTTIVLAILPTSWHTTTTTSSPELGQNNVSPEISARRRPSEREREKQRADGIAEQSLSLPNQPSPCSGGIPLSLSPSLSLLSISDWISP